MSVHSIVTVEYHGLTHECTDPNCHVPGFVATLEHEEVRRGSQ